MTDTDTRQKVVTETTAALLAEMKAHIDSLGVDDEILFEPLYAERIKKVGAIPFFTMLFRELQDSTLTNWMFWLAFAWKNLPFDDWRTLLRELCADDLTLYRFVWFASTIAAIDIGALLRSDPAISDATRAEYERLFPDGAPRAAGPGFQEVLEEFGVDQHAMWRRLAAEGAPMLVKL